MQRSLEGFPHDTSLFVRNGHGVAHFAGERLARPTLVDAGQKCQQRFESVTKRASVLRVDGGIGTSCRLTSNNRRRVRNASKRS
jgi:hypothetical protein